MIRPCLARSHFFYFRAKICLVVLSPKILSQMSNNSLLVENFSSIFMHFFIKGLHKGGDSLISIDLFAWHVYKLQNLLILTISSLLQRSMWLWQHYKKRTTFMEFKAGMLMILKWSTANKRNRMWYVV